MAKNRPLLLLSLTAALIATGDLTAFAKQTSEPIVVQAVAPSYPPIALAAKAEGEVSVQVEIDSSGKVKSTSLVQGPRLLQAAALEAAQAWLFTPSDSRIQRKAELIFHFTILRDGENSSLRTSFRPPYEVEVKGVHVVISDPTGVIKRKITKKRSK